MIGDVDLTQEQQRVRGVLPGLPSRGLPRFQVPPKRRYLGVTRTVVETLPRLLMETQMNSKKSG